LIAVVVVLASYLAGSIPTGVLLARRSGIDVRRAGSGNIGATNVARTAGRMLGILTLVGDAAKGLLPVLAARALALDAAAVATVGVAAIAGHVFSVFLGFRGGKGVATGFGVLLGLDPSATIVPIVAFAVGFAASRIVSVGSLAAAVVAPIALWLFGEPPSIVLGSTVMAALIISRHAENISRLLAGTEHRFHADR
jgi:glycerol-3-phosphate acyltransferase PlsY